MTTNFTVERLRSSKGDNFGVSGWKCKISLSMFLENDVGAKKMQFMNFYLIDKAYNRVKRDSFPSGWLFYFGSLLSIIIELLQTISAHWVIFYTRNLLINRACHKARTFQFLFPRIFLDIRGALITWLWKKIPQ